MTVAELIEKLQEQPQDLSVVIAKTYMEDLEMVAYIEQREGDYYTPESFSKRSGNYIFIG